MRVTMKRQNWIKCALVSVLLLCPAFDVVGQAKKPLDHSVYDIWNRIRERAISNDGQWVLLSLGPEEGDVELRIESVEEAPPAKE